MEFIQKIKNSAYQRYDPFLDANNNSIIIKTYKFKVIGDPETRSWQVSSSLIKDVWCGCKRNTVNDGGRKRSLSRNEPLKIEGPGGLSEVTEVEFKTAPALEFNNASASC